VAKRQDHREGRQRKRRGPQAHKPPNVLMKTILVNLAGLGCIVATAVLLLVTTRAREIMNMAASLISSLSKPSPPTSETAHYSRPSSLSLSETLVMNS